MDHSTLTPLTLQEFREHIRDVAVHGGSPTATCAHHTYSPTSAEWNGLSSMEGIRRYHMDTRGYSDIAANFYVGPDGLIWTARPMTRDNWAHAFVSRPWPDVHEDAAAYCNGDEQALNSAAVGIEIVGNYDHEDPATGASMQLALDVFAAMHERWGIPLNRLLFHRMVADKSCPGTRVSLDWFRAEVAARTGQPHEPVDDCPEWAREARDWVVAEGISDGTRPNDLVTRAEVWTMLYRMKEV